MAEDFRTFAPVLEEILDTAVTGFVPVRGGMINYAAKVETQGEAFFVKWKEGAPPDFFAAEADGLDRLRQAGALRVPEVVHAKDGSDGCSFLILEYIKPCRPRDMRQFTEQFGYGLARLHREAVAPAGMFGLPSDNYLGIMPQENGEMATWTDFYRERRLLPQIEAARRLGRLPAERERLLMVVIEKLDALLEGLESQPVLLHGDLWSGNYLEAGDEVVVCDPAVYYGEREMEIAYMELFGGFSPGVLAAYQEDYPLSPGYPHRRIIHQLYHLLNHLNHFGGGYGAEVDAACKSCLA